MHGAIRRLMAPINSQRVDVPGLRAAEYAMEVLMSSMEAVARPYLQDALDDLESHGRYWIPGMSSGAAQALQNLVALEGRDTNLLELAPEWEHVLALPEAPADEARKLAVRRAALRAKGVAEAKLPR